MTQSNPLPTTKRLVPDEGEDFYPTEAWATHGLLLHEHFEGTIWECACGNGIMAEVLATTGNRVIATDKFDRGYGQTGVDFLTTQAAVDNIITNPPYNKAEEFVHHALKCARKKVALFLRLAFLEGIQRYDTLYTRHTPLAKVLVCSERATFYPNGIKTAGSGTMAYGWFIWEKGYTGDPVIHHIPVGTRAKYGTAVRIEDLPLTGVLPIHCEGGLHAARIGED